MKKYFFIAAGILFCAFTVTNTVDAAKLAQDATTGEVKITAGVQGAQDIVFNPSSQVKMTGGTVSTSFVIVAHHNQANLKKAGQQYGMAADSNSVWFKDISGTAPTAITTETNKNAFASGWYTM